MRRKLEKLTTIMKETAAEVCPVKVHREELTPWMTTQIRELRRRRNRARRDLTTRREEWTEICRELKEKTTEAKRTTWQKNLEKIREEKSVSRAWSMVKQLRGDKQEGHGGAMLYRGIWRTTPRAKANAFIQEYAGIIAGKSDRRTRREIITVARHLRGPRPRRKVEKELTMQELERELRSLKLGNAPGPDDIRPEYLKHLPDSAKVQLLEIASHSWQRIWIPQVWRTVIIIPILKKGKDASKVDSYRPIALTSQVGKCVEKMVVGRMTWWLEENKKISPYQAGFRSGRSTTDPCLRL